MLTQGLNEPTSLAIAPDGRIFVGEKSGTIKIFKDGTGLLPTPFYTLSTTNCGEGGLIGLTLDPDFASNGFVYVHYSFSTNCNPTRVSRITASPPSSNVAAVGSEFILLEMNQLSVVHNAGGLQFGPDGKLYISVGEKSTQSSQSLGTLYGKLLRMNSDGSIPGDNPTSFAGVAGSPTGINRAIWAIGFRNPFRFAIQPESGRMFVNDVSDGGNEEIDDVIAGGNYGYPATQGNFNQTQYPNFTLPLFTYSFGAPGVTGNCIVGGTFYCPLETTFPPDFYGHYFFADLNLGAWVKRIDPDSHQLFSFATNMAGVVDLKVDAAGRLLLIQHYVNKLYRIDCTLPLAPRIVRQPAGAVACVGDRFTTSVVVSGAGPVSYRWRRNGVDLLDGSDISGAHTRRLSVNPLDPSGAGEYRCFVQNANGTALSAPAVVTVGIPNGAYDGRLLQAFVDAAIAMSQSEADLCRFDFDGNGRVDTADVGAMATALIGS